MVYGKRDTIGCSKCMICAERDFVSRVILDYVCGISIARMIASRQTRDAGCALATQRQSEVDRIGLSGYAGGNSCDGVLRFDSRWL